MPKIISRREARKRRMKYQIAAGMADFIGILLGIMTIIVYIELLVSLDHWLVRTGAESFSKLWDVFTSALIVPD